jgi:hypothetical protein
MDGLENVKVGDEIYYRGGYGEGYYDIRTITRETKTHWILVRKDGYITKVNKKTGKEVTGETGRFASFHSRYWEPVTPEIKETIAFTNNCRQVRNNIESLSKHDKFQITPKNIGEIEKLLDQILELGKVEKKGEE